jgi:hypothetical protein
MVDPVKRKSHVAGREGHCGIDRRQGRRVGEIQRFCYRCAMNEPSLRRSRLTLAGGIGVALAVGGGGFLIGRGTSPRDAGSIVTAPVPVAPAVVREPPVAATARDAVQTRAELIALAAQATDALASGKNLPETVAQVAGRRFELRLPFGCHGPTDEGSYAAMRWRYDENAQALRVHVAPIAWGRSDLGIAAGSSAKADMVEGFWIPRPWTVSETCPVLQDNPAPTGADTVTLPGQTLAIAQFFESDGARQGQRDGKPYETVVRMAADEIPDGRGLQLRISGRITNVPGDGPISCRQPAGAEQRPICIVAVTMDDVAIENPRTGKTLATWNVTVPGATDR